MQMVQKSQPRDENFDFKYSIKFPFIRISNEKKFFFILKRFSREKIK